MVQLKANILGADSSGARLSNCIVGCLSLPPCFSCRSSNLNNPWARLASKPLMVAVLKAKDDVYEHMFWIGRLLYAYLILGRKSFQTQHLFKLKSGFCSSKSACPQSTFQYIRCSDIISPCMKRKIE